MSENLPAPSEGSFLFYQTEDGTTRVRVILDAGTVWMSQRLIAELYDTSVANINIHLRNIFEENELQYEAVVKEYLITAADGKNYRTKCYSLEAILAVGYRVRSTRGTQFRRWATQTLREYLVKGFVLDDERLKAAEQTFGQDYFDELLQRIRDIRASERRFYQKITDTGAVQPKLNQGNMKRIDFVLPPQNVCAAFRQTVAPLFAKYRANVEESRTLSTARDALLPKLLSGEIRVGEAEKLSEEVA